MKSKIDQNTEESRDFLSLYLLNFELISLHSTLLNDSSFKSIDKEYLILPKDVNKDLYSKINYNLLYPNQNLLSSFLVNFLCSRGYSVSINHKLNKHTKVDLYVPDLNLYIMIANETYSYNFYKKERRRVHALIRRNKEEKLLIVSYPQYIKNKKNNLWISVDAFIRRIGKLKT